MRAMTDNRRIGLFILLLTCGVASLALTACNTVEGAGKDVENLGEAVQDVADGDD